MIKEAIIVAIVSCFIQQTLQIPQTLPNNMFYYGQSPRLVKAYQPFPNYPKYRNYQLMPMQIEALRNLQLQPLDQIINDVVAKLKSTLIGNSGNSQDPTEDVITNNKPNEYLILVLQKLIREVGGCGEIQNIIAGRKTSPQGNQIQNTQKRLLILILQMYFQQLNGCDNVLKIIVNRQPNEQHLDSDLSDLGTQIESLPTNEDETEDVIKNSSPKMRKEEEIPTTRKDETEDR